MMLNEFNFAFAGNTFIYHSLRQLTVRFLHHKFAVLVSAVLVALGGAARGEHLMKKNLKSSQSDVPVYTSRSGSRYVRAIDVIRSKAGRRELSLQLQNQPKNSRSFGLKLASRGSKNTKT